MTTTDGAPAWAYHCERPVPHMARDRPLGVDGRTLRAVRLAAGAGRAPACRPRPSVTTQPVGESVVAALIFAVATVAVAGIGAVATSSGRDWYDTLEKPSFTPPDATFGIVWTILYVVIAVAGWLAWRASVGPRPTTWWAVQMALNLAWTAVFFGLESPVGGVVVIAALIPAVAMDVREAVARRHDGRRAAVPLLRVVLLRRRAHGRRRRPQLRKSVINPIVVSACSSCGMCPAPSTTSSREPAMSSWKSSP